MDLGFFYLAVLRVIELSKLPRQRLDSYLSQ